MNQPEETFEYIDAEALLLKLNTTGEISDEEFQKVITILKKINIEEADSGIALDDLYALLLIVGKVKKTKYQYLFNKYLELQD